MVAADDNRRLDAAAADEVVEREAERGAIAVSEPEDARRQPLERDPLARQPDPSAERLVAGEHLQREIVGRVDVGRLARQRGPTERTFALAKERADELGHEPWNLERVGDACLLRLRANVVAVVE